MKRVGLKTLAGGLLIISALMSSETARAAEPKPYYTVKPIFNPYPSNTGRARDWDVKNFGPVGIGIKLKPDKAGFTMLVNNIEKDSPAEATGKLKKGQIIESINGTVLKDRDPREILGDVITEAEAKDGKVKLEIKDVGEVVVKIPIMGSYSPTWPLKCKKSDRIVRKLADLLAKDEKPRWGSVLFLLSTGEEKDLAVVKKWMANLEKPHTYPWHNGYLGVGICEYYLRTGDEFVLPHIRATCENLKGLEYEGGWSGRGHASFTYMSGGQLHAAGVHCLTFLLMARYCGVDVDDGMLRRSLKAFYRFNGHGNVAYGDHLPEGGFRDNGKTGALAVAMQAASLLTPEGESSVYAKARDNSAMKSFYATNWFHAAHTGGGIGEIWHNAAMSMISERRPKQYRSFLDTRRWVMELSRRHTGAVGIAGMSDRYDISASEGGMTWGTFFALTYTIPRKKLQLYGAAKSGFAKNYKLPVRPWGNATDDVFLLSTPVPEPGGITMKEVLEEVVATDSSAPLIFDVLGAENAGDATFRKYLCHPEIGIRIAAMRTVVNKGRANLVVPMLKSKDPRGRHNGLLAITGMFKGRPLPQEQITPEMVDLIGKIIENKDESWWVLQDAIHALGRTGPASIAKHKKRLLEILKYDSWWVQAAAVKTLAQIAFMEEHYKDVLTPLAKTYVTFRSDMAQYMPMRDISNGLKKAPPAVQKVAFKVFSDTYTSIPRPIVAPGGHVIPNASKVFKGRMGELMSVTPEGVEWVKSVPKITTAYARSGKDQDLYRYSGTFEPNPKVIGNWLESPRRFAPRTEDQLEKYIAGAKDPSKWGGNGSFQIQDKGKVRGRYYGGYFWSGNMLIGTKDGLAKKMEVRTYGGKDFLIVETGGFDKNDIPKEWYKKYSIFMRKK